ncbi:glycosyltransferase family 2 protein [Cerasicoccus maritimus]|uniref:glycosyltransferase family 2 protein n=1 Tax=Cerasicoccus maritimus TaxID=490089 RepID=UPI0028524DCC|nr:glycosyltransferase family 2 protein [Cerasicoccus maritimus]
MPKLSIIVPTYMCPVETGAMLATLDTVSAPYELILVDDNSNTETLEMLRNYVAAHPEAQLFENEINRGFAVNCNAGAKRATGDVLLFLNNDLVLKPGWFEPMWQAVQSAEDVGIVGNVQFGVRTGLIDHAGMFFHLDGVPRQARKGCSRAPAEDVTQWRCVSAACIMVRRSVFNEVGGFDEGYRNGCEDADLCVRLTLAGYRHLVCNRSVIQHHVSVSPGRHKHNDANLQRFIGLWSEQTKQWGAEEWAPEFWKIYQRKPWKIPPSLWPKLVVGLLKDG